MFANLGREIFPLFKYNMTELELLERQCYSLIKQYPKLKLVVYLSDNTFFVIVYPEDIYKENEEEIWEIWDIFEEKYPYFCLTFMPESECLILDLLKEDVKLVLYGREYKEEE